ncbi:MAG TPA: alpha/beta hydrolase [Caulobacteraceae bacterium]|jgi:acetyl esterase/lipase
MPDPTEVVPLWPGRPPGAPAALPRQVITERSKDPSYRDRAATGVASPTLTVFRPARPNGAAVLLIPGGGYIRVVIDKEGFETARPLNDAGVTAFVLRYRLPAEGWTRGPDVPLQDAQRAIRVIRSGAREFGIDPARVAAMGFSAGGHLAASLATRHAARVYAPVDAADTLSARPDLAALIYPVILMSGPAVHAGSRGALIGANAPQALADAYSPNTTVGVDTPPTFLLHACDDASVPVENALAMAEALRRAKIPLETHLFEEGGHGFGLRLAEGKPVYVWPQLFLRWAERRGLLQEKGSRP